MKKTSKEQLKYDIIQLLEKLSQEDLEEILVQVIERVPLSE